MSASDVSLNMKAAKSAGMKQMDRQLLAVIGYVSLTFLAILCILPFILIVSSSLTEESKIVVDGFQFFPTAFSVEPYKILFKYPDQIIRPTR